MPKQQRTFTAEFKKQMVGLYENGKSRAALVKEYGLTASALTAGTNKLRRRVPSMRKTIAHQKKISCSLCKKRTSV